MFPRSPVRSAVVRRRSTPARCVAAGLVATFAGRAFYCAALLAAEHDVVLASLVQWVSGARHDRLQFRHADSQSPQLLRLTAQAGQFLVALIGSVDVKAETLAERLDLVAGLPVRRILRQGRWRSTEAANCSIADRNSSPMSPDACRCTRDCRRVLHW